MTVIRKWSGAGLSPGALTTSSAGAGDDAFDNITVGGSSALSIVSTGTRSPRIQASLNGGQAFARWSHPSLTTIGFRIYLETPSSWPSGSVQFISGQASAGVASWYLTMTGTSDPGRIRILNSAASTAAATASGAISTSTKYRVEGKLTMAGASGAFDLRVFNEDSTTPLEIVGPGQDTLSVTANFNTVQTLLLVGNANSSPPATTYHVDDIALSDANEWVGPWTSGQDAWTYSKYARFGI